MTYLVISAVIYYLVFMESGTRINFIFIWKGYILKHNIYISIIVSCGVRDKKE
jgi:hypothetical protein